MANVPARLIVDNTCVEGMPYIPVTYFLSMGAAFIGVICAAW